MNNRSKACFFLLCLVGTMFLTMEYYEVGKKRSLLQLLLRDTAELQNVSLHWQQSYTNEIFNTVGVGQVNYDVWRWMSGYLVDDMRLWWDFPNHPEERKTLTTLYVSYSERAGQSNSKGKYAHKVYGYILPPKSGAYVFEIHVLEVSCQCGVEFWISSSMHPKEMKRIVSFEHGQALHFSNLAVSSEPVILSSQLPYYFEFFEKAFDGDVTVEIRWKAPDSKAFVAIPSSCLSKAIPSDTLQSMNMDMILKENLPSNQFQNHHRNVDVANHFGPVTEMKILPMCEFTAKYAYKHEVPRYTGIKEVFYSAVYPHDQSTILSSGDDTRGANPVIEKKLVDQVINLYGKALKKQYPEAVAKLIHMEETKNVNEGSRFLIQMEVKMSNEGEVNYMSEYTYLQANTNELCATSNFKWKDNAPVYLVIATKNIGKWAQQFIYNIEQIYAVTKDENFDVIFVDYNSSDFSIMEAINASFFKRNHLITLSGNFSRAGGLQAALEYITDPNSIIMTMDLHLYIPVGFIHSVRKHVIQGRMAYAPVLVRLGKGYSEVNIRGYWETFGYGIYGLYKSDWTAIGGYNITQYKYTWGGEDYDIVDKCRSMGYEVFRLRYPGFVHYFHTYGELWDSKKSR